jgi:hypothetical protein
MPDTRFRGDCGRCDALCCTALAFDRGPHFAIDKPAGVACPNVSPDCRCTIHDRLAAAGFGGCAAYDCLGAGQLATAMFVGLDLSSPSVRRARLDAFARLRRLQVLRFGLDRLGDEVGTPATYAALLLCDFRALERALLARMPRRVPNDTDKMRDARDIPR